MTEAEAMDRALSLAWRGWGRVHPNPLVGAIVLRDGVVVGQGWHGEFGGPHAEVAALAEAGAAAAGATLVVTLEPCVHHGKQPPCTDAIQRAGIRRVVAALADPNQVAAGGAAVLRSRHVEVEVGLRGPEACRQNAAFRWRCSPSPRPWVALKLATSLDGAIADASGHSRWVSGLEAREYVHWLRAGFDALAVGGATARADDPALTVRGSIIPRVAPRRVVLDRGSGLPAELALVRTARDQRTILVTSPAAAAAPGARALERLGVSVVGSGSLDEGLRRLREQEDVHSVLVEGGGRLAGALLEAGLVDRLYWIQAPVWLGQGAVPAFAGLPARSLDGAPRWSVSERRALGEDTLLVVDREPCSPDL
ncbi:MAG TPA: bifunctional diaminohydroxyphosphoribosylaminopyrimidine deaminase/5-amino-6-(5-phosphoribosylamino)uracil reductase RibD [Gemmatimonadales bacterium]|nr:bifunctional diaminohydroxyphosphoribosylaminopyrimidine deaminase/5-amino-6-(5-phosphoribosylamino)uracil reductase RibD [Gemmatimonadales bacterium]